MSKSSVEKICKACICQTQYLELSKLNTKKIHNQISIWVKYLNRYFNKESTLDSHYKVTVGTELENTESLLLGELYR